MGILIYLVKENFIFVGVKREKNNFKALYRAFYIPCFNRL
jgi:hypothetical protein